MCLSLALSLILMTGIQREGLYVDYDTLLDIAIDAKSDYDIAL